MVEFSIIIPVYNVEKYLRQCLDSIVNQTFSNFEVICINDGSTDNSLEILNEYAAKDKRFIILSQENQGQGIARNKAIDMANGEIIMFVDPDDFIDLNALEILYNKYKETNVEIVQFDYELYRKDNNKPNKIHSFQDNYKEDLKFVLKNNQIFSFRDFEKVQFESIGLAVWSRIYSTKFIKENNIKFAPNKHGEDHIFSLKSMMLANKILYINTPFYHYRERIGSAVNKASNDNFCVFDNIKLFKNFLQEYNLFNKYKKEYHQYIGEFCAWQYFCIPLENIDKYLKKCEEVLNKDGYKKFKEKIKGDFSILENIFSLKNQKTYGVKHKVVTVLGMHFFLKPKTNG